MTYQEFQALMDEYMDGINAYAVRTERNRPERERLDALTKAVKAKDALWERIRIEQPSDQP